MLVNALDMDWHHWLARAPLARQVFGELLRSCGYQHLARLDHSQAARSQKRILFGLVHRAGPSLFGRQHDFRRIRTRDDFRRLVPLTCEADQRWASLQTPRPDILLDAVDAAHRQALRTALALTVHLRPRRHLLRGQVLSLDSPAHSCRLPHLIRPFTLTAPATVESWKGMAHLPITAVLGPADRLQTLLLALILLSGKSSLQEVWPGLTLVLALGDEGELETVRPAEWVGDGVLSLQVVTSPQGPFAVADPGSGLYRLLCDHGLYYELLPIRDGVTDAGCRLGIEDVEPGVTYELVVTSPAGFWAWRTGKHVSFEASQQLLFRFLPAVPAPARAPAETVLVRHDAAITLPPGHPQSAGIPAEPPESFVRSPWSLLADRG
jgi:hypothetical protein